MLKVELDNAQAVPHLSILNEEDKILMQVYFCKDGGLISIGDKAVGCGLGIRPKSEQDDFEEAEEKDGIFLARLGQKAILYKDLEEKGGK